MKNNIIHEIIGRIYETRFKVEFKEEIISFIKKMNEGLLESLINLDDYDFNYYLSFMYKIYLKNNLNYQDKLIKITSLLIPKLGSVNANSLVDILVNTNLIEYKDIVKFTSIVLNIKEINRIDKLVDIIYDLDIKDSCFNIIFNSIINSKSDIERDFILSLTNSKRIVNSETELKKALDFLNKTKYEDKLIAFYKIFMNLDISLYSEYAMTLENAIIKCSSNYQLKVITKLSSLLKQSRFRNSIIKKILNTKNKYALKEYLELFKIDGIINYNNIIEILDKLDKIKNENQGIVIEKLVNIKPSNILLLIDEVLKKDDIRLLYVINYLDKVPDNLINDRDLFSIVLDIKDTYKFDFLMKVLEYKFINRKNIKVIKDFFKVKEVYKYEAFNKYLSNNKDNKEFRLDSDYSNNIIMLLKDTKKDFQANTLVRVSNIIKEDKHNLLIKATYIKNEAEGILFGDLLETNIMEDNRFLDILDNFENCDNLCGQVGMVELARDEKIRNSEFLIGYFMIMKRFVSIKQVAILLDILDDYPDLNDYNLFKYCCKIMFVTNYKLLLMLEKLIINNKKLDKETIDLCILAIDKNSTHENIRFIKEYLRLNNLESILEDSSIDIEEFIGSLNRQKTIDLNPNSILTYKKIRSGE